MSVQPMTTERSTILKHFKDKMVEHLTEGNSPQDLALQVIERLTIEELRQLLNDSSPMTD